MKKASPTKIETHTNEKVSSNGKVYEKNTTEIKYYAQNNILNKIFSAIPLFLIWFKNYFN